MTDNFNFFPGGNTPQGFYSFYDYLPYQVNRVFIIKGGPGTGKSTFMKRIGEDLIAKGYSVEYHWCSSDNESLDGIVCKEANLAVLDGTAPHVTDPVTPGAVEEIFYTGDCWDDDYLEENRRRIQRENNIISKYFRLTYDYLEAAKIFFDRWQEYYQKTLNVKEINRKADQLLSNLPLTKKYDRAEERHLFGAAITPNGPVEHYQNLTKNTEKCYIIKGNPGTGKSLLLENIAREIFKRGYFILYLHRTMEPDKYEGLIIPDLNTAFICETPPYQLEAKREIDEIINLNKIIKNKNYIQQNETELYKLRADFANMIKASCNYLNLAKQQHDELEKYYIEAMDFDHLEEKRQKLMQSLNLQ
ncbi:MAG: hypothetical protein ACOC5A_06555 [Halanaerobiales bacterium]